MKERRKKKEDRRKKIENGRKKIELSFTLSIINKQV
jgi:hypothetical protein